MDLVDLRASRQSCDRSGRASRTQSELFQSELSDVPGQYSAERNSAGQYAGPGSPHDSDSARQGGAQPRGSGGAEGTKFGVAILSADRHAMADQSVRAADSSRRCEPAAVDQQQVGRPADAGLSHQFDDGDVFPGRQSERV